MRSLLLFAFGLLPFAGFSQNWDIRLLRELNVHRNTQLDPTFKRITQTATPISLGTPAILFTYGLIKKQPTIREKALVIGAAVASQSILSTALKFAVDRPRPFVTYPDIQKEATVGTQSFPSGHTGAAFATATALTLEFPKWYVAAPAYTWASAVGYSRMHLGVHYPSDVLAGALLGTGTAFASHYANRWLQARRAKKKAPPADPPGGLLSR